MSNTEQSVKHLISFISTEKRNLDCFMHYCLEQQKIDPDNWPISSWNDSELQEQYEAYVEHILGQD